MSSVPQPDPLDPEEIEATAAVWLTLRDRGMNDSETAEFMRWLQQDRRHAEIFAQLDRTWQDLSRLHTAQPAGAPADPEFLAPRPRRRAPVLRLAFASLAAAAVVTLAVFGVRHLAERHPTAETAIGALQTLDLPDGSVVRLNTDSAVEVRYSQTERRVRLIRGEAHFSVAKDATKPFIVAAGGVAVRAVGTAFNVRLRPEVVEVLVTAGRVGLDRLGTPAFGFPSEKPIQLGAGERILVPLASTARAHESDSAPVVATVAPAEVERVLAWQERRVEFESMPLSDVVAEFNRHNRRQLVIVDEALKSRHFSGTFRADGVEAFLALLQETFEIEVERTASEIRLSVAR